MSYNSLFGLGSHSEDASLEGWWPLQDNAASTAVVDQSSNGNDGTLVGGDNTADLTTTGPNSWLTAALDLDGSADHIGLGTTLATSGTDWTFLNRLNADVWTNNATHFSIGNTINLTLITSGGNKLRGSYWDGVTVQSALSGSEYTISAWHSFAYAINTSGGEIYVDGATAGTHFYGNGVAWAVATGRQRTIGARDSGSIGNQVNGKVADTAAFSRRLTAPEIAEWDAGPEPINTVAPALSGTELVGETLTATSGTWALDAPFSGGSNGTVTYSYQWTRSDDDSGTNEADITDATNSTYVLTASDAGKYVRCRVRGTNDGGFDANADTNTTMSGKIATTALLANLDAHYKLDETSGTVMRNEVRTEVGPNSALTGTGGTSENGTAPDDWFEFSSGAGEGSATITSVADDGNWTTSVLNGGGGNVQCQVRATGLLTIGVRYTCEIRWRLLEEVVGTPELNSYGGTTVKHVDLASYSVADGWQTTVVSLGAASQTNCDAAIVRCLSLNDYAHVEIDSIAIYEENAGTYVNSPTLGVPGKVGTAVTYNGTSQYANCPVAPTSYPFTMSGWCKPDNFDAAMRIFQVNDLSEANVLWGLAIAADGNLLVVRRNTTDIQTDTGIAMAAGVFTHLAVVFEDATTARVYVDGSLAYSNDSLTSVSFSSGADGMLLGLRSTVSVGGYFDGALDDIRLYSRALSPTEAYAVYQEGLLKPLSRTSLGLGIGL